MNFQISFAILVIIGGALCDLELLLLHTNDMHGRFEEMSRNSGTCKPENRNKRCYGGFARVAHVIKEARENAATGNGPKALFLNAGDTYTGTPWFSVHKWKIAVDLMNRLQPDAISFGNHEFDYGIPGIVPFVENFKYPIVAANLDFSEQPAFEKVNKSVILNVNGIKIGVIGYLTRETVNIGVVGRIKILDEVTELRKESERLDREGVKILIALGHSGFDVDKSIAENVPLIDVVIGGHTNTFLWNGKEPDVEIAEGLYPLVITQRSGKKVPVVQAYAYTKYMGRLLTRFNDQGDLIYFEGKPMLLDNTIKQDPEMLEAIEPYRAEVEALMSKKVGYSRVTLDQSMCRVKECNFGNLVTDALIDYKLSSYSGKYWTDTAVAITNGGSIRATIDDGEVSYGDFMGALPFDLQVISFNLNGSDVKEMFEISARSNGETSRGEFLQVSGAQVTYDLTKPVGQRVMSVKMRCAQCNVPQYEPLDMHKSYRMVASSFLMDGGDGYHVLRDKSFNRHMEDLSDLGVVVWYIEKQKTVYPDESFRVLIVEGNKGSGAMKTVTSMSVVLVMIIALFQMQ